MDQRKKSELPGSSSLKELRNFAGSIHEGVCVIDENGIVIVWNSSAEKLYNISAGQILGRRLIEFFPNALMEQVRLSREARVNMPHHPQGKDNTHILISATPWYVDGEFKGVISTDRNYDEVIKLYAELENARAQISFLQGEIKKESGVFASLVGHNANFLKSVNQAVQIAPSYANVMISGESGTGKEMFAKGIHELSGRKGLFIPINSSAIPSELFESEFFGYAPGAFTGASRKGKPGYFEMADGGTVFLDEISEMPLVAQAKLLRVLQEREVMRVGGSASIRVDARVIAASNKNLAEMMRQNKFREDLYYRLNVVEIKLTPLRERQQDIPLLIRHFLVEMGKKNKKTVSSLDKDVVNLLCEYDWPGNVRELMNVVENLVVTSQNRTIKKEHIPEYMLAKLAAKNNAGGEYQLDLATATHTLEAEKIRKALELCKYNKTKAARMLGIPRASLYNKMNEYGLK